jgi:hypothetical protein
MALWTISPGRNPAVPLPYGPAQRGRFAYRELEEIVGVADSQLPPPDYPASPGAESRPDSFAVQVAASERQRLGLSDRDPIPHKPMKIGIDLGITSSALAYIDEREAEDRDFPPIHIFETPQLVAPGRTEPRRTLPSFLFLEDGQPVGGVRHKSGGA